MARLEHLRQKLRECHGFDDAGFVAKMHPRIRRRKLQDALTATAAGA